MYQNPALFQNSQFHKPDKKIPANQPYKCKDSTINLSKHLQISKIITLILQNISKSESKDGSLKLSKMIKPSDGNKIVTITSNFYTIS